MPIRTSRGRAAAYRSVWQWPLRSPARLAVSVAVLVAVAALVGVGAAAAGGDRAAPAAPVEPTRTSTVASPYAFGTVAPTSASAPSVLSPVPELNPTTLPLAQAPAAALEVAGRWAVAWVRPPAGTTAATWLDGLRPNTTAEYLGVLGGVDPANIPATKVTGAPTAVRVSPRSVVVDVPTDALTLRATVVVTETGAWKVSGYDRA
jgi:hypothetical protein